MMKQGRGGEAPDAVLLPMGEKKKSSFRGAYRAPLFNLSVCLSVCVSVIVGVAFHICTDCESYTWPISTIPGSMKTGG